jgi:hypothetical protein
LHKQVGGVLPGERDGRGGCILALNATLECIKCLLDVISDSESISFTVCNLSAAQIVHVYLLLYIWIVFTVCNPRKVLNVVVRPRSSRMNTLPSVTIMRCPTLVEAL